MELTAAQARGLTTGKPVDEIMLLVFEKIRSQAAAGREFAVFTEKEVPGSMKWGKLALEWSGMGGASEFNTPAQPIITRLRDLGYGVNYAHSEGDGPHPEWWGFEVKW